MARLVRTQCAGGPAVLIDLLRELLRRARAPVEARSSPQADPGDGRLPHLLALAARRAAHGDHAAAAAAYRDAAALQSENPRIWCNLGVELNESGRAAEAESAYRRALELEPGLVQAWYNLGLLHQKAGTIAESERCYRLAAALVDATADRPLWTLIHRNWGLLLYVQGRTQEAAALYQAALELHPDAVDLRSNFLFTLNYLPGIHPSQMYGEHAAWGALHARQGFTHNPSDAGARPIRLGYVSADFCDHALASFVEPVLANHDRAAFRVTCYNNGPRSDAITARMKQFVDVWRDTRDWDDEALAQAIHADGIDILIDVSGHTSGNRLLAFARKPAPIQVGYIGYFNTTGMHALDFRVTDAYTDPPGASEQAHTEKLLRLPHSLWCFRPHPDAPPVSALPAAGRGHVTFGSFNHIAKLGDRVLQLWTRLLHEIPGSRLLVLNVPDDHVAARIRAGLPGIDPGRVTTLGRFSRIEYWRQFADVDIALDPFPYNGGATTCDTLWMGVPVVTLAGDYGFSRIGATILSNVGLEHLIAPSASEYVEVAASLAADQESLAGLRRSLRERMLASPLLDAPGYTRALESAYRRIWDAWRSPPGGSRA
jgi:protein O-GlcNAc transferase